MHNIIKSPQSNRPYIISLKFVRRSSISAIWSIELPWYQFYRKFLGTTCIFNPILYTQPFNANRREYNRNLQFFSVLLPWIEFVNELPNLVTLVFPRNFVLYIYTFVLKIFFNWRESLTDKVLFGKFAQYFVPIKLLLKIWKQE